AVMTVLIGVPARAAIPAIATNQTARTAAVSPLATPPTPSGVTATPISATTIHVTWTDTSGGVDQFVLSNGNVSTPNLAAGITSYDWGGLSPNTYMCFTVKAVNSIGDSSSWSAYGCTTTPSASCQASLDTADSSGYVTFYHGTAQVYANDIAANGINLSKG